MKIKPSVIMLLLAAVFLATALGQAQAAIRKAVWAGAFYPASRSDLNRMLRDLTEQAAGTAVKLPEGRKLKALILPHAGYVYSGLTAAHASLALKGQEFSKVLLLGPDHRVGFADAAISDADGYETPLGVIPLHRDTAKLRSTPGFKAIPASDSAEHSLEVILPFLQYYLKSFALIPIVLGSGQATTVYTKAIAPTLDNDTLLVVSSDLSHYLPYDQAKARDQQTIDSILKLDLEPLKKDDNRACGARPILVALDLARTKGWQPILLKYNNSGDTAGDKSRVVGYSAIAFYGDQVMEKQTNSPEGFTPEQGQTLLMLARQTISAELGRKPKPEESEALAARLKDQALKKKRGTFVTLHIRGELRGCIGSLSAYEPLSDSVRHNAINAAFRDSRFRPLSKDELDKIDIEVSILTEPQQLAYANADDLLKKLKPHIDGVIIHQGFNSATFLPQVWEQLPDPQDFLSHLCNKAGLTSDAWQRNKLEVETYQVQYFAEKK